MTETVTPAELAGRIWGSAEAFSRSNGARTIRRTSRKLFPRQSPGLGGQWQLTSEQVAAIRRELGV